MSYIKERKKGGGGEEGEKTYVCALVMHSWSTEADVTPVSSYHSPLFWVSVSHWAWSSRSQLDLFASEPPAVSSTTTSPEQEGVGHVQCHASFNVRLGIWTQAIIQVRWAVSPASQLSSFSNFLNCSGSDPLQNVHFANVFFCALGCHLILVTTSCALQKLSSLMQSKAIYSNSLALFYWNNLLIL